VLRIRTTTFVTTDCPKIGLIGVLTRTARIVGGSAWVGQTGTVAIVRARTTRRRSGMAAASRRPRLPVMTRMIPWCKASVGEHASGAYNDT
jgi:hypothetical protein